MKYMKNTLKSILIDDENPAFLQKLFILKHRFAKRNTFCGGQEFIIMRRLHMPFDLSAMSLE
jgi:hypothetical protein